MKLELEQDEIELLTQALQFFRDDWVEQQSHLTNATLSPIMRDIYTDMMVGYKERIDALKIKLAN